MLWIGGPAYHLPAVLGEFPGVRGQGGAEVGPPDPLACPRIPDGKGAPAGVFGQIDGRDAAEEAVAREVIRRRPGR